MTTVGQGFQLVTSTPGALDVTGVLNFNTAAAAVQAIESALSNPSIAQLDLAGITHADSAGLSCLVTVMAGAARQGRALSIIHMPDGLKALATVSEVDQLID